jgi:hypothetical protein
MKIHWFTFVSVTGDIFLDLRQFCFLIIGLRKTQTHQATREQKLSCCQSALLLFNVWVEPHGQALAWLKAGETRRAARREDQAAQVIHFMSICSNPATIANLNFFLPWLPNREVLSSDYSFVAEVCFQIIVLKISAHSMYLLSPCHLGHCQRAPCPSACPPTPVSPQYLAHGEWPGTEEQRIHPMKGDVWCQLLIFLMKLRTFTRK